jgi:hypothetical protein
MMAALPSMRTQEAIAFGEGVALPMHIRFDDLPPDRRPRSEAPISRKPGSRMLPGWISSKREPAAGVSRAEVRPKNRSVSVNRRATGFPSTQARLSRLAPK